MDTSSLSTTPDRDSITILGKTATPGQQKQYEKMPRYGLDDMFEGGALRDGGAARLFSKDYIGLVAQYAAVGLIDGLLPNVIYPFMQNYLNLDGKQTTTAATLVQLAWSFKVFYGMLSDCFPINGYRRRPYMLIGWVMTLAMLLVMASTPVGKPYFTNPVYRNVKPKDYTDEMKATFNYAAADSGSKYIIPMMLCAFGYLLADVCADGIVVELAQREPLSVRGTTQSTIYATRTVFNIASLVIIAFGFNGEEYGGDFKFSISFPILMLIVLVVLVPILPVTWFCIREERSVRVDFGSYVQVLWEVIQTRAVYQVIAYTFFSSVFARLTYVSRNPIQVHWAGVSPLYEKIGGLVSNAVFAGAIWFTGKYGLQYDWRKVHLYTMVAFVAIDSVCTLLTIWDVYRSTWFWLTLPIIEQFPAGISFIVSSFVIVELSREGHEGAMYGLLTTVSNLSTPFSTAITRNVDSAFDLTTERIQDDSTEVRWDITVTVLIMYGVNLLSLGWLVILPRQKEETQMLKRLGGSSYFMGAFTICYLGFALVWSVTTNILSIYPSTACLTIAGGDGCGKKKAD
ncbi:Transmembrane protein [Globisporangium polare]